jgi:NADH dehydrogenase
MVPLSVPLPPSQQETGANDRAHASIEIISKRRVSKRVQNVLIVGGGFAGASVAMALDRALSSRTDIQITLVNRENFFLFTPMLHEVAASDVDITHIVNPIRRLLRRVQFFHAEVEAIDLTDKTVTVVHGQRRERHNIRYDALVIALGSTTNFYGIPGLSERAMTMKSLGDAIHLRNRLVDLLEEADLECALGERRNLLTIVVAGGGFAGTETVAAINDFLRESTKYYQHLSQDLVRTVLIHPGPVILPELGPELGEYAQAKLVERGVEVRIKTKVTGIAGDAIELSDQSSVDARTLIWTAGTSPNPLIASLPCVKEQGRLLVNEYLEVPGWDNVWALGDCAYIVNPVTGHPYPPTAQHAIRQAKTISNNVATAFSGGRKQRFLFAGLGQLAAIGRRTGVARILGVNFSGFVAWFLWRTVYLAKLPRFEKKLRVALDWTLDLFFAKDLVHFMILRSPTISQPEDIERSSEAHGAGNRPRPATANGAKPVTR